MISLAYWVDIEDASGNKLGAGPISPEYFDVSSLLSAAGEFSFPLSPADPNFGNISQERFVVCRYLDKDGAEQEFGGGRIRKIVKSSASNELNFIISGLNTLGQLRDLLVGDLQIGTGAGGDTDGPDQIMDFAPAGWSIVDGTTAKPVYVRYDGQTVLASLVSLSDGIGEHFRLGSGRVVEWLGNYRTFLPSGVRAIKDLPRGDLADGKEEIVIIENVREVEDSHELVTRIYPRGSGNGSAILRLEALTESLPAGFTADISEGWIQNTIAVATYGIIEKPIDYKNISPLTNSKADKEEAANQLMRSTVEYIRRWDAPQRFYDIDIVKADKTLLPGQTIDVIYQRVVNGVVVMDIDETLNIVDVRNRLDYKGINTVEISVSTVDKMPMTDTDIIVGQIEAQRVSTTHAQLNANAREIDRKGTMDDANPLQEDFWFGLEVVSIKSVILRFKIDPLRSTVKTVAGTSTTTASGGGSTSGSGGSSTPTSSSGGSSSPTSSSNGGHFHTIGIGSGGTITHDIQAIISGGLVLLRGVPSIGGVPVIQTQGSIGDHTHTVTIAAHTHTVTIAAHTHTTPDHTHDLTPNITTEYGIFEETLGNTLDIDDIVIKINTVALWAPSSIGGGWYEIDITTLLIDSAFSPNQSNNNIVYETAISKTAQITTSLAIVDIVQAVSIL